MFYANKAAVAYECRMVHMFRVQPVATMCYPGLVPQTRHFQHNLTGYSQIWGTNTFKGTKSSDFAPETENMSVCFENKRVADGYSETGFRTGSQLSATRSLDRCISQHTIRVL
jgi:hypothetical protein